MTTWDEVKCYECSGKCNKKGFPSAMKGSAYCESNRGLLEKGGVSRLQKIKNWLMGGNA